MQIIACQLNPMLLESVSFLLTGRYLEVIDGNVIFGKHLGWCALYKQNKTTYKF